MPTTLVRAGADLLDVGGVKAGPGPEVSEDEELDRVVGPIEALHARFDVAISCDTWRASVLDAACVAGAVVGNDISGFGDPDYLAVAAKHDASVVATHIRLRPRVADPEPHYDDLVGDVTAFLLDRARRAEAAGLAPEQIALDAGLDLGKTPAQSAVLLRESGALASHGYALLLSASNKRFLGELLDLDIDDRRAASLAVGRVRRRARVPDRAGARRRRIGRRVPGRSRRSCGAGGGAVSAALHLVKGSDPCCAIVSSTQLLDELLGDEDRSFALEEFTVPGKTRAGGASDDDAAADADAAGAVADDREAVVARVLNAASSPPFMTASRVVVVRDCGNLVKADVDAVRALARRSARHDRARVRGRWRRDGRAREGAQGGRRRPCGRRSTRRRRTCSLDAAHDAGVLLTKDAAARIEAHLGEDAGRAVALVDILASAVEPARALDVDDVEPYLGDEGGVPCTSSPTRSRRATRRGRSRSCTGCSR